LRQDPLRRGHRALLQRLSLFADGATLPAIEAVCAEWSVDDDFAAAWTAGRALPLAEIFHLANHEGA
jgi:hypothetical protein